MENQRNIAPVKLEVLFVIAHNNKVGYYSSLIQKHKANLQITFPCKGTSHQILNVLGLTDRPKSIIMSVIREDEADSLIAELDTQFNKGKDYKGVAATVPFSSTIGALAYGFLSNETQLVEQA